MSDIVVFGSFVVDLMARSAHIPVPGETIKSSLFRMGAGGKGSNQAVACKLSGGDVSVVTLSPGRMRMKFIRSLPEMWASTVCPLGSST